MIPNIAGILIFLSIFGIVVSYPSRAVDCRKYVFAPVCRGVASKRALPVPDNYDSAALVKGEGEEFLLRRQFSAPVFWKEDEDGASARKSTSKQGEIESVVQGRMNLPLKWLFGSRSNSERDYSFEREFESYILDRKIPIKYFKFSLYCITIIFTF